MSVHIRGNFVQSVFNSTNASTQVDQLASKSAPNLASMVDVILSSEAAIRAAIDAIMSGASGDVEARGDPSPSAGAVDVVEVVCRVVCRLRIVAIVGQSSKV